MNGKSTIRWTIAALLIAPTMLIAYAPLAAQANYWFGKDGSGGSFTVAGADAGGAFLGVQTEEEVDHAEGGARVTHVVEGSPAEKAGLREGDIVVGFDGKTIRGPVALTVQIRAAESGDKAELRVIRDGRSMKLDVELGERKSAWSMVTPGGRQLFTPAAPGLSGYATGFVCDDDEDDCATLGKVFTPGECKDGDCGFGLFWDSGRPLLGVELVEVTDDLREHLGGSRGSGVLISKVVTGTPAERAGLQVGDLIVAVAGDNVKNTRDLRQALQGKRGQTFAVEVVRDRNSRTIEVSIPEPSDERPTGPRAGMWPVPPPAAPAAPPRPAVILAAAPAPPAPPSPKVLASSLADPAAPALAPLPPLPSGARAVDLAPPPAPPAPPRPALTRGSLI